ncbi:hypothetical protein [Gordonia desulfuricans]|uniref:hypothetical protein n=1 Tax=Gordonia desulfuricans TaxID=89051 RepID=UPI000B218CF2|nr:hypothetical protein [Gordonia desulfuricans]
MIAGQFASALDHAHTALALGTERGDPLATHLAAVMLGIAAPFEGDSRMGLRWNDQAFRAYLDCGGIQICDTVEQRGNHLSAAGEIGRAGRAFAVCSSAEPWPQRPSAPPISARRTRRPARSAAGTTRNGGTSGGRPAPSRCVTPRNRHMSQDTW